MSEAPELSLIAPLYNEGGIVVPLVEAIDKALLELGRSYEILLINDGSTDRTAHEIQECLTRFPNLCHIELSRNFGQTAALAAGIEYARGKIIISMDGDLQHDPKLIRTFVAKLEEGYDSVCGFRAIRTDGYLLRRIPSMIANLLMRRLTKVPIQDMGSTYRAYRANVIKSVQFFGEVHRFVPVLLAYMGARMAEIPISVAPRTSGRSKYGISRVFGVFEDILFLTFFYGYLTRPIRVFGRLFFLCAGAGAAISIGMMVLWFFGIIGALVEHSALLLLSLFLMIVGIQFLVSGIIAEILCRMYISSRGQQIYFVRKIERGPANNSTHPCAESRDS